MRRPEVGATARRTRRVREADIRLFTELTGDRNPLHYDAEAAARSRFGGVIVQGGVTSGLLNAVVAEDLAASSCTSTGDSPRRPGPATS
jgi:acyl dehydratase